MNVGMLGDHFCHRDRKVTAEPCWSGSDPHRAERAVAKGRDFVTRVLYLDEPTVGLDVKSIAALEAALAAHRAGGGMRAVFECAGVPGELRRCGRRPGPSGAAEELVA